MGTRITEHPILGVPEKGKLVSFTYDGQNLFRYTAVQGLSALLFFVTPEVPPVCVRQCTPSGWP